MAFDGAFLSCLKEELESTLIEARVDKIHQPSREELVLDLRSRGCSKKLYISARANSPRVHFTEIALENPSTPPMFCMLLRKRLIGGRLTAIRQPGLERALYLDLDCVNELGDIVQLTLATEIMGRHSNIILIDSDLKIIDSIKRIDFEASSIRPVLPGLEYSPPPVVAGRMDLSMCSPDEVIDTMMKGKDGPLSKALLSISHGLSPLICREVSHLATRGRDPNIQGLTQEERHRAIFYLGRIKGAVETGENRMPYILYDNMKTPLEFSFMPITQYGLSAVGSQTESFSSLLDEFYAKKDAALRAKQRSQDILRVLTNSSERIARKLENQQRELKQSGDRDRLRIYGDLIHANMGAIQKGANSALLVDYYDPDCGQISVPLDPALSAAQNAQKYYKEYRKAQTAERILKEQIEKGKRELLYIDTVFDALSRATTVRELGELRDELAAGGYLKVQRGRQKSPKPLGPLEFVSDDGFKILVGRNNVQNDRLTLKTARGRDIWFHTKNIPGSHVIVLTGGETPPEQTLEQAAILAALHSKAAESQQVPVDYTPVRNIKKPKGAPPGFVIYEKNLTAYVTPDKSLIQRLMQ
ncbi:MAG: NFACT RNA binding domain-containing protein [Oscillospiraceae bacterium]|nr:NFACT RNA binding domain-containing protein [Oscillospiraceae bacterium]